MFTIKPGSSQLQEPDPAFQQVDPARIIFLDDEPKNSSNNDNDEVQPYQMAKKTQGSQTGNTDNERAPSEEYTKSVKNDAQDDTDAPEKDTHLDTAKKALTDEYKKGLKDETIVKEQLLADETVQEKVSAIQAPIEAEIPAEMEQKSDVVVEKLNENIISEEIIEPAEKEQKMLDAIEQFNKLMQERRTQPKPQPEKVAPTQSKNLPIEPAQKIESKKHRPIEIGLQNQSKLELTKDVSEGSATPKKRKLSLQDLNLAQGFSEFIRKGNADFSADGNSDHDDEMGMKRISYMTQFKKTHTNAFNCYPDRLIIKHQDQMPPNDSIINMIIDRTGKITLVRLQSSGNQIYDDYHMKVLIFMGDLSSIPKYMEAPLPVKSIFYTQTSGSSFG